MIKLHLPVVDLEFDIIVFSTVYCLVLWLYIDHEIFLYFYYIYLQLHQISTSINYHSFFRQLNFVLHLRPQKPIGHATHGFPSIDLYPA